MSELESIRQNLWTTKAGAADYADAAFQRDLLEQYKLCVEMADRISARRGTANAFFMTFNTGVVGALGTFFADIPKLGAFAVYLAGLAFCVAWFLIIRSYRTLNSAKFTVIGLMEERLPSSPIYAAEWKALGEGKDWRRHIPLSRLENIVPAVFAALYVYLAVLTLSFSQSWTLP